MKDLGLQQGGVLAGAPFCFLFLFFQFSGTLGHFNVRRVIGANFNGGAEWGAILVNLPYRPVASANQPNYYTFINWQTSVTPPLYVRFISL